MSQFLFSSSNNCTSRTWRVTLWTSSSSPSLSTPSSNVSSRVNPRFRMPFFWKKYGFFWPKYATRVSFHHLNQNHLSNPSHFGFYNRFFWGIWISHSLNLEKFSITPVKQFATNRWHLLYVQQFSSHPHPPSQILCNWSFGQVVLSFQSVRYLRKNSCPKKKNISQLFSSRLKSVW